MTHKQRVVAFAAALAAMAAVPAAAPAHPVDCAGFELEAAPSGERYIDWGGGSDGCVTAASEKASASDAAPPVNSSAVGDRPEGSFEQVGHEPLRNRGMNAAIAVQGDYAYVGSRTDGGHVGQPQGGLMVVDVSRAVVAERRGRAALSQAGRVHARTARMALEGHADLPPDQLRRRAGPPSLHGSSISNIRFYDIRGTRPRGRGCCSEFKVDTHEFFLWEDPEDSDRALIFAGNATSTCGTRGGAPSCPFSVWDISARAASARRRRRSTAGRIRTAASQRLPLRCRSRPAGCTR